MREPIQIKLPASLTAATVRVHRPAVRRRTAVPARELKPAARQHAAHARGAVPRRAAY
ncbi:hypothetical protein [Nonomuraea candida]|uniref:hypothetical protein n=1 Tax=Nonomuraea candida TaxID=359159 RepID=UPI000A827106|nr:hypothetical protein [Nonomuraea candida]